MANQKRSGRSQAARQAALAARRRRDERKRLIAAVVASAVLVLGVTVLVGGGEGPEADGDTTTVPTRKPVALSPVPPGAAITGATPCPAADGSATRTLTFASPPPLCIDPARDYVAEIRTSKGTIVVDLLEKRAPRTVNNFVVLARYHYYDGIPFHRVIPGFVIQVGDPTATGGGGPGYRFEDELPPANEYRPGAVAMAHSGPNTNGSQFFVVTGDASQLPPTFSLFGTVTRGMDVARAIEAVGLPDVPGDPNSGKPTELVTIDSITIKET